MRLYKLIQTLTAYSIYTNTCVRDACECEIVEGSEIDILVE